MSKIDWKSYEELVKDVYEQLGRAQNVNILCSGSDCRYTGKSGVVHQIDVLAAHSDGIHEYLTDIECKYWEKYIDKDIVMKVKSIVEDCNFSKGIVVSKNGFSKDAIQYAENVGIGLVELREMSDEDWTGRIRHIILQGVISYPILTDVQLELLDTSFSSNNTEMRWKDNAKNIIIEYPSGDRISLASFIETTFIRDLYDIKLQDALSKTYPFEQGTTITIPEIGIIPQILSIKLTGRVDIVNQTDTIDARNEILYYMKCIFENVEFFLNKEKQVVKRTTAI